MEPADARFSASHMMRSSMMLVLASGEVGWTTYVSIPRTFSPISTWISPSEKRPTIARESGMPSSLQMDSASFRLAFPEKIL